MVLWTRGTESKLRGNACAHMMMLGDSRHDLFFAVMFLVATGRGATGIGGRFDEVREIGQREERAN